MSLCQVVQELFALVVQLVGSHDARSVTSLARLVYMSYAERVRCSVCKVMTFSIFAKQGVLYAFNKNIVSYNSNWFS